MLYGIEASIRSPLISGSYQLAGSGSLLVSAALQGGPSFAAYTVPGAVHFDGSSWLQRGAALSGVNSTQSKFILSVWVKLSNAANGLFADGSGYFNQGTTATGGYNFFNFYAGKSGGDNVYFDSMYEQGGADPQGAPATSIGYQHLLASLDRTVPAASLRINNVDVFNYINYDFGASTSFTIDTDFFFGNDSYGSKIVGDVADFQLWIGQYADFSSPTNVGYFYSADGSPVDPANAAAHFGQQTVLFSGGASTFGTNQGSGGTFTLNGSLTDAVVPGGLSTLFAGAGQMTVATSII